MRLSDSCCHLLKEMARVIAAMTLGLLIASTAPAQLTQEKLSKITAAALKTKSVSFDPPSDREYEGVYLFDEGRVLWSEPDPYKALGAEDGLPNVWKPLVHPTQLQFKVELIRAYRNSVIQREYWKPHLRRVEQIVSKELDLIVRSGLNEEDVRQQLERLDQGADDVFEEAIQAAARMTGITALRAPKGAQVIVRIENGVKKVSVAVQVPKYVWPVQFKVNPAGGRLFYMTWVDYEVAKAANVHTNLEAWTAIKTNVASMPFGYYVLYAKWAEREMKPVRVRIDGANEMEIAPD